MKTKNSHKPLGAAEPPKLRMRVGFRRVAAGRGGEQTPFFFLGSTSAGFGVFGGNSIRVALRRKVFEGPEVTRASKQWF